MISKLAHLCGLLAFLALLPVVQAAYQFQTDSNCQSCLNEGAVACRPKYYDRYSFCCDATEVGSLSCGGQEVFCSNMALVPSMKTFACPYSYGYCGASSHEIELHPERRNNIRLEISNRLFTSGETCYYVFFVPTSSLDTKRMRYFFDINVTNMTNVDIVINNGTSLQTAGDSVTVGFRSGYRF